MSQPITHKDKHSCNEEQYNKLNNRARKLPTYAQTEENETNA